MKNSYAIDLNKDLEEKSIRQSFGILTGGFFLSGDTALIFKGVIDKWIAENTIDMTAMNSEPLALANGLTFATAGLILLCKGNDNKWAGSSMVVSTIGAGFLTAMTIVDGHNIGSKLGAVAGGCASAYGAYQAYKRETKKEEINDTSTHHHDVVRPTSKNKISELFSENVQSLNKNYPFWALGVFNVANGISLASGAYGINDYVMLGVAGAWTIGSGLLAFALPKVDNKPQPA